MRAHTKFCIFIHCEGADLYLEYLLVRADDGGVQRLVAILLGSRDVVVEFVGNHAPEVVHDAERGVTVTHLRHQNTHCADIEYLRKIEFLCLHLAPDAVDVLGPPGHFRIDIGTIQLPAQLLGNFHYEAFAIHTTLVQKAGYALVVVFLQVTE